MSMAVERGLGSVVTDTRCTSGLQVDSALFNLPEDIDVPVSTRFFSRSQTYRSANSSPTTLRTKSTSTSDVSLSPTVSSSRATSPDSTSAPDLARSFVHSHPGHSTPSTAPSRIASAQQLVKQSRQNTHARVHGRETHARPFFVSKHIPQSNVVPLNVVALCA